MNREKLERQLESVVWRDREFGRHKAWLKAAVVEIAQKKNTSWTKKIGTLANIFMNKLKFITALLLIAVISSAGVGVIGVYLKKDSSPPSPLAKIIVPDAQALSLVESALEKIEELNNLTLEEERKKIEEKIQNGLNDIPDGPIGSTPEEVKKMYQDRWSSEARLEAFRRMKKSMEEVLKEARNAQDLSRVSNVESLQKILEPLTKLSVDKYDFNALGFSYKGPFIVERTSSFKRPSIMNEEARIKIYHKLGYSSTTIEELLRPSNPDEEYVYVASDPDAARFPIIFSFRIPPAGTLERKKFDAVQKQQGEYIYFTTKQGQPVIFTLIDGLPDTVYRGK